MNFASLKSLANKATLLRYVTALWLLLKDPRTPWLAKVIAGLVVAYALSPIDLIPDVIPVLGQLDDLVLIPIGVWLAVRCVPKPLWTEMLANADTMTARLPRRMLGLLLVLLVWLLLLGVVTTWLVRSMMGA